MLNLTLPEVNTAREAIRQTTCIERAKAILNSKEYSITQEAYCPKTGMTIYKVDGPNQAYLVSLPRKGFPSCTCPSHNPNGGFCKHSIAVEMEDTRIEEMIANHEAEEEIRLGAECYIDGCAPY